MAKAAQTRKSLIETTALRLFAERGYAEVSIKDIAQECGIVQSAIYRHTNSKEELAIRVFREAYLGFAAKMDAAAEGKMTLEERLSAYLKVMLKGFDKDAYLIRFLLAQQHDTLNEAVADEDATPLTMVRDAIETARATGAIEVDDIDMATAMVMGAALQPLTFMLFGRISRPAISHHDEILKGILKLLGAQ
ncbi:TetR/AcrR family transcriptional regulator [Salipiger sp. PrR003]|uniref:TetR/AcrR family transcriptional regulator n=1 Tax=Salipiger sp. PrR003 TaxID=2706776 RepID=UPI0013DAA057|nr:TetR/AcrR family transcriptional regulator [Salipiger sp. PrR003]NDV50160.1 TetR/AcrR family transcriptional regulator [Salipiger sp. PrR003]